MVDSEASWKIWGSGELPVRCWEGDYVVYNPLTGSTHVLDIVTGEVLKEIGTGSGRESALCQRVAEFLEVPNDAGVAIHVREILAQLDDLGLIERMDGC
jgi:PqqD family protein of HPr-rel-A system